MAYDHSAVAQPRLTGQFYESKKLWDLVGEIVAPLTGIEDTCDDFMTDRWIETAIGRQLDGCGYIVRVARKGREDEPYRAAIKAQIAIGVSGARIPDLCGLLAFITQPMHPEHEQYLENWPATAILHTDGLFVPYNIQSVMQSASAAGIENVPVMVSYEYGYPWRMEIAPDIIPFADFFVNDVNMLTVTAAIADLQVTNTQASSVGSNISTLGGLSPPDLWVNGGYLAVGSGPATATMPTLVVNDPNAVPYGGNYVPGVFAA